LAGEARRRVPWEPEGGGLKTPGAAFFNEPEIIREEALFLAADLLAAASRRAGAAGKPGKQKAPPRRAVLRRALSGALTRAADLGPIRLERAADQIRVKPSCREYFDRGFSLLIKAPGSYTLKGGAFPYVPGAALSFAVSFPAATTAPHQDAGTFGGGGFFARLPLVLKTWREGDFFIHRAGQKRRLSDILKEKALSGYGGFVTAWDPEGCAAFIAVKGENHILLLRRSSTQGAAAFVTVSAGSVEISGGIDA
jgi:hypothetical protein